MRRTSSLRRWITPWPLLITLLLQATSSHAATVAEVEQQFRRGDAAGALQRAAQALAAEPGNAAMRFLQAVMLAGSGLKDDRAAAEAAYERMTQDFPELPEPYNNLAVLRAASGRLDDARLLLEAALRLDPTYRVALENLGDVLMRLAERAYSAALEGGRGEPALQGKLRQLRGAIGPAR